MPDIPFTQNALCLKVLVLHPGITPLGNDPEWFKITRFYPEMCLNGVNTQWVYSQGVAQKPFDSGRFPPKKWRRPPWRRPPPRRFALEMPRTGQHHHLKAHGCRVCWPSLRLEMQIQTRPYDVCVYAYDTHTYIYKYMCIYIYIYTHRALRLLLGGKCA